MSVKDKSVIKHSATVQITNKITLLERKAWNVLLANAYNDLPKKDSFRMSEADLKKALKIKTRNRKHLQDTLSALVSCAVEFNYLGKDKKNAWKVVGLLAEADIEAGVCEYKYTSTLQNLLYQPEIYARISLSLQNKFKSKHALALYELCVDYYISKREYGITPFIGITEFRGLMGIEEYQYKTINFLNRDVIKPAISEINEKSDLSAEVEYQKESRKITALRIHIKPNPKKGNQIKFDKTALIDIIPEAAKTAPEIQDFIDSIADYGIDASVCCKTIASFGIEGASEIRDYAIQQIKAGTNGNGKPIDKPAAYMATCLEKGWGLKTLEQREAEQQKIAAKEKTSRISEIKSKLESIEAAFEKRKKNMTNAAKKELSELDFKRHESEYQKELESGAHGQFLAKEFKAKKKKAIGYQGGFTFYMQNKLLADQDITDFSLEYGPLQAELENLEGPT